MKEKKREQNKPLRWGFSTGTAASAAVKGALTKLLGLPCPDSVSISLPGGGSLDIPLHSVTLDSGRTECIVIKDGGDDPDVTHKAEIGARVRLTDTSNKKGAIKIVRGEGVGLVTKPGLPVPIGEPAINPVPGKMIRRAVRDVLRASGNPTRVDVEVEIFAPRGEELSRHTFNPRLGILGGISILGTTGLVKPYSHSAYRATVMSGLRVAKAAGLKEVVFSTGGKSERYAQRRLKDLPSEAFVQMGDFVRFSLTSAGRLGFEKITVASFFGKAVKMAQGLANTHASYGEVDLGRLAQWAKEESGREGPADEIKEANTARGALEVIRREHLSGIIDRAGKGVIERLKRYLPQDVAVDAVILDFSGVILWTNHPKMKRET